jgi:DNA-binding NarL/FixJ family response regulator
MAEDGPSLARISAYRMLDTMPPGATNEQKSLRLSVCGFSNSDIAEMLGISVGSVSTNLYEARKKLGNPRKAAAPAKTAAKKRN